MKSRRAVWQEEEDKRKDFSIVLILQEQFCSSELSKVIQDAILLILFPVHIPCRMCFQFAIYHQFGTNTWRSKFEPQTDSIFLLVDLMDKNHKDPDVIDLNVPRRAQYVHKAWNRHQDAVFLGRHQSCSEQRINILSDSIECNHPSRDTSSLLYSESC